MRTTHDWAAGIVDGEGHIKFDSSLTLEVSQSSTTGKPEMLKRLQSLYGGTLYGPYRQLGNRKPKYEWHIYGADMLSAMRDMWPALGKVKRLQYRKARALWKQTVKTPRVKERAK